MSGTYNDEQAAYYLGISKSTLAKFRMTKNGNGPAYLKLGRSVRYLKEDLDAWLTANRIGNSNAPQRSANSKTFYEP